MKKIVCIGLVLSTLTGCQPANISAVMRGSDRDTPYMETRCEPSDMRDATEMQQVFSKYDGWRMVYLSEFTTGNRFGTVGVICFERPKK
ncbi:hypothetical protein [Pelotalea chapellei]|uniref:Lipoprotein n=1 Tax=Pelotalea chapellei TaxID=44671 RepID=A0ABS5UBT7_9BACT|nr:hypothetical protein [Pelotalea chapellei]MBT1073151.1 hypothetical protein [Pelotalea chapellei]